MTYNDLKDKARELGIEVKGNPAADILEEQVRVATEEAAISGKNAVVEASVIMHTALPKDSVKIAPMTRQEAMRMVKVKITPLDESLKGLPSDAYSVANKNIGTVTQVVVFNKPTLVFKIIVDMLKSTQMPIGTPLDNGTVEWSLVEAFAVQEIPLTEEELAALKAK